MAVANCLSTGILAPCSDACCSGGINRIAIAKLEDVTSLTRDATDAVTAIVMNGVAVFYEIKYLDFSASLTQSVTVENNNTSIDQVVEFTIPCWSDTNRQRLQELLNCCCGNIVIVELMDGKTIILADPESLIWGKMKIRTIEQTTGAALADPNQQVVTLGTFAAKYAVEFTGGWAAITF